MPAPQVVIVLADSDNEKFPYAAPAHLPHVRRLSRAVGLAEDDIATGDIRPNGPLRYVRTVDAEDVDPLND